MTFRKNLYVAAIALLPLIGCSDSSPAYKNPDLSPEQRAADLLKRMTTEEKIMQLQCIWSDPKRAFYTDGKFDEAKIAEQYPDGIGSLARPGESLWPVYFHQALHPREAAEQYNEMQRYFVEKTRLGIPVTAHDEIVHGQLGKDGINFPVPIALGCTWDEELMEEVFSIGAKEARSKGAAQGFGPILDPVRDPRWGRTEETMGEDPFLISRLGIAAAKGLQGEGEYIAEDKVGATLKHFGVHGQPEGGHNTAPSYMEEHEAREQFLFPFREVMRECDPMFSMITYNEFNGRPAHANPHLLKDILRTEFGWKGVTVSDYDAIFNLHNLDGMCATLEEAAVAAINAGMDIEFPNPNAYPLLKDALEKGLVSMGTIDAAVKRVLISKFRMGLFEHPYADPDKAEAVNGCEEHRKVAYRAASEAMVLLKNDGNALPLDASKIRTIALIGPNADRCILGGYSGVPRDTITPLRAIKEKYGDKMNILYAEGVRITDWHSPYPPIIKQFTYEDNKRNIQHAVDVARRADVVVMFVGANEGCSREAYGPEAPGDLPTLELLGGQKELIDQIVALHKPTVAFVNSGTTLSLEELESKVPAVMQCWYLGQEGGYAMIDALFGDVNPSGKLAISFPRSAGGVPVFYNHKKLARRGYNLGFDHTPLHPFGYGLSYTSFAYSNLKADKVSMGVGDKVTVSVDVKNTGSRKGTEVVQLYITDDYASMTRPVKELKGFRRVSLEPGESQTVAFDIDKELLSFYDFDNKWVVEPGTFTVGIGGSSDKYETVTLEVK